LLTVLSISRRG